MTIVEDIFGVKAVKKSKKGAGTIKSNGDAARRPDGVSREVFFLTGGATPAPIVPTLRAAPLRSKPTQKRAWMRQKFYNSARSDNLALEHWVRVGEQSPDYPFAKFNRPIRMVTYTTEEYEAVVKNLLPVGPVKPIAGVESGRRPPLPKRPRLANMRSASVPAGPNLSSDTTKRASPVKNAAAGSDVTSTLVTSGHIRQKAGISHSVNKQADTDHLSGQSSSSMIVTVSEEFSRRNTPNSQVSSESVDKLQHQQEVTSGPMTASIGDETISGGASTLISPPASSANPVPAHKKGLHFVPPQKPWTREETDLLFQLCQQFDLRFPVIFDRWPETQSSRSIDELKDRYYSVAKAVTEYRMKVDKVGYQKLPTALQKHCQMIYSSPFDYEYECIRKNQLERQYRRSKEELREEEETVRNARRIESNQRRLKKERERLAKLLTPTGDICMTGPDGRGVVDAKVAMSNALASQPQKLFPHRKVTNGAYARSSLIYTPVTQSARIAKRVDQVLDELGVGTRPTPTSHVVDSFDLLRMDILSFLELQRTLMRKEEEAHVLRERLAKLKGEPAPNPPEGVVLMHKKRKADDNTETSVPAPLFS